MHSGSKKAIRSHNLGNNYTRDAIIERITTKREKMLLNAIGNYTKDTVKSFFIPSIIKMKKYKDMTEVEKKRQFMNLS